MKIVTNEVYHLWAHQTQTHAWNAGRTKSFNRLEAFSYAAVIGKIATNAKGERAYLYATRSWSVTTSGHQCELRQAIPSGATKFPVYKIGMAHDAQVQVYLREAAECVAKAKKARTRQDYYLGNAHDLLETARAYAKFFGVKCKIPDNVDGAAEALARQQKADAKKARERERERIKDAAERIDAWINGGSGAIPYGVNTAYLRVAVDGLTVETSHHATAPLADVLAAIPLLMPTIRAGKAVYLPSGIRLGNYAASRVESDGTLVVGCHRFARSEVERFAATVGYAR